MKYEVRYLQDRVDSQKLVSCGTPYCSTSGQVIALSGVSFEFRVTHEYVDGKRRLSSRIPEK